jgi:hypothetical protein
MNKKTLEVQLMLTRSDNQFLLRQNSMLLERLHNSKRQNREDKVRLKNSIQTLVNGLDEEYENLIEVTIRNHQRYYRKI